MEWLTNLLGFANNGTSPFGALSGSTAMTPPGGAAQPAAASPAPAAPAATPQPAAGGMQLPGLLGKLMGQQGQTGTGTGTGTQPGLLGGSGSNNSALLGQAMNLLKGQQIQAPPMMNLLSGPRG